MLDSLGRQSLESKSVSTTSTPDHAVVTQRTKGPATIQKVAAEGGKYCGFGVVIEDGSTVEGKSFSAPSLEPEILERLHKHSSNAGR